LTPSTPQALSAIIYRFLGNGDRAKAHGSRISPKTDGGVILKEL
jgi:hypothetical protein